MTKYALAAQETQAMFLHVAKGMVASKDRLTQADKAIGDGDHGVGMARGFEAVQKQLTAQSYSELDGLLRAVGTALITSVGGAAGAVFGTLFMGGAQGLQEHRTFDGQALYQMLSEGLAAVQGRGKAQPGDKTMVDALHPAVETAQVYTASPLSVALENAAEAARGGLERTKEMVARVGKAKSLGIRSRGHIDPGALSMVLILEFMAAYVEVLE